MHRSPPVVLSFSLIDPTGAAGALADSVAAAAMGCHLAVAVTCIAVQDTREHSDLFIVDDDLLDDQARAVLQDMSVAAIKIGAMGSTDQVQTIAVIVSDYDDVPVVLDPRLDLQFQAGPTTESDGAEAAAAELAVAMRELLMPQVTLLTVNLRQARRLVALAGENSDANEADDWSAAQCARRFLGWGVAHVLVTAADAIDGQVVNTLFGPDASEQNESLVARETVFSGAGDTLSTALTALLAQGIPVSEAVREANDFLAGALAGGYRVGMGHAVPDRLFWAGEDEDDAASEGHAVSGQPVDERAA